MVRVCLELLGGKVVGVDDELFKDVVKEVSYTKDEIDVKLSAVLKFKGTVATKSQLPLTNLTRGDVWAVTENNLEYVWLKDVSTASSVDEWEQLGPLHDLSAYYTKAQINAMLGTIPTGKTIMDLIGMDGTEGKSLKELITELTTRVSSAEGNITSLNTRMSTAEDDISSLASRMATAEGNITTLDSHVAAAEGDIDTLEGRADALETRATTNETNITDLQGRMTTAEGSVTSISGRVTTAESEIDTLQGNTSTLQTQVTELFSRVGDDQYRSPIETTFLADCVYYKKNSDQTFTQLVEGTQEQVEAGTADYYVGQTMRTGVYRRITDDSLSKRMATSEQTVSGLTGRVDTVEDTVSTMETDVSTAKKQSVDALGRIGNGAYKVPTTSTFQSGVTYAVLETDLTFTQITDFTVGGNIDDYEASKGKTVYYQFTTNNISERLGTAENNISGLQDDVWTTLPEKIDNTYNYSFTTSTLSKPDSTMSSADCWNELAGKLANGRPLRLTTSDCEVFGSTLTALRLASCGNVISTAEYDPDDPTTQTGWDKTRMIYFYSRITAGHLSQIQIKLHWHEDMTGSASSATVADSVEPLVTVCKNDYDVLEKLGEYFYYIEFNENYDYDRCLNYFGKVKPTANSGACTSIRKDNLFGRNLDWTYNDKAKFVIRTNKTATRHASIGVAGNTTYLTDEIVNARTYSPYYFVLPFVTTDGINDAGVCVSSHVVPTGDYGTTTGTMATGATRTLCNYMIPRFVLDNFSTAKAAADYIHDHVNVYCALRTAGGSVTEECAYFIADATETYLVEFINNTTRVIHLDGAAVASADKLPTWETNFYRTNKEDSTSNIVMQESNTVDYTASKITLHGMGIERWNYVAGEYAAISSAPAMMLKLKNLWYTSIAYGTRNVYSAALSEFVEGSLTLETIEEDRSAFQDTLDAEVDKYESRSRDPSSDNFGTWETNHSAVYDISKKTMWINSQEWTLDKGLFFSVDDEGAKRDHGHSFVECFDSISSDSEYDAMHMVPAAKTVDSVSYSGYYCESTNKFLYFNNGTWYLADLNSGGYGTGTYTGTKYDRDLIFVNCPGRATVTIVHRSESTLEADRLATGSTAAVDTLARANIATLTTEQKVIPSTKESHPFIKDPPTYSLTSDLYFKRYHVYYKRLGSGTTEDPYTYSQMILGTDYLVGERVCQSDTLYERTGEGTHTYQSDLTATFLANRTYSRYDKDNNTYIYLTEVESNPGTYEYVAGTTTFGDKAYAVFLEDPYVYTVSSDTYVNSSKTYCLRTGGTGTTEDPYTYEVLMLTANRVFVTYVQDGYSLADVASYLDPLISPHKQTST